ncbi:Pyrokinin-1 receptor, partial [Gryllus bimaculatus]
YTLNIEIEAFSSNCFSKSLALHSRLLDYISSINSSKTLFHLVNRSARTSFEERQISHFAYYEYPGGSRVPACHTRVDTVESAAFFVATISVFFALPLLLLVGLYAAIARRLRAPAAASAAAPPPRARTVAASRRRRRRRRRLRRRGARVGGVAGAAGAARARRQVVVMLGAVVACFFVCLLPFRALTLWIVSVPKESLQALGFERYFNILSFCRAMTYLNSAVNPILYNLMSSKFRAGFLRLCCEGRWGGLGRGRGADGGGGHGGHTPHRLLVAVPHQQPASAGFPRLLRADATPPPTAPAHARSRAAAPATPPTHSPTPTASKRSPRWPTPAPTRTRAKARRSTFFSSFI